jgi:DnaA family protein
MRTVPTQLTFSLGSNDEAVFDNFYLGKNAEIIDLLKRTARGEGERMIYLCGTQGQGCSHLLQACCHYAYQNQRTSTYLPLASLVVSHSPEVLSNLESLMLVCIDDLDAIAGKPEWEEAIFHLYNRVYDAGGRIIIAAHDLPKAISIKLPDLVSRLSWCVVYQLHPLLDDEKLLVLKMRANHRGIGLSDEIGKYILTHSPRQMSTLFAALDALDQASLAAQRRLTIPFVKEILQI